MLVNNKKYKLKIDITFIITLLAISFLLNKKIKISIKYSLLLFGLMICIYQPLMTIPFFLFYSLFYCLLKKKNIETFELGKNIKNCEDKENNEIVYNNIKNNVLSCKHSSYLNINSTNYKNFLEFIDNKEDKNIIKKKLDFYKNFFRIYFFDLKREEDWLIINHLIKETYSFNDLIDIINVEDENDIFNEALKVKHNNKEILNQYEKNLKKLGMFFYQDNSQKKNLIMEIIKNMGLYSIYMNIYKENELKDKVFYENYNIIKQQDLKLRNKYDLIRKYIYELAIIHYESSNSDSYYKNLDKFEFKPYILFNNEYLNNKTFKSRFDYIRNYYLIRIPLKDKLIKNLIDENSSLKLLNSIPKEILKNKVLSVADLDKNIFIPLSNFIRDSIDNLELLEQNYYMIENHKSIAYNYLCLLFIFNVKEIRDYLDLIDKKFIVGLYNNKKNIYENQLKLEELNGKYSSTSEDDLLIDNIFYYFEIYFSSYGIKKIYPVDYHLDIEEVIDSPATSVRDFNKENEFKQQQYNYQLKLDKEFDDKLLEDLQEQQLDKYYNLLDRNNYDSIKQLNELAEKRNEELRIKNESFNKKVEDFSKNIYEIIDEISELIKDIINDRLEGFNDGETITNFQKYLLVIKKLSTILFNQDRALYTGFLMIVVALFLYFIDDNTKNYNCNCNNTSMFDKLKLI